MKAYKTEIKPNKNQKKFLFDCINAAGFIFNMYLDVRQQLYKYGKQTCSAYSFDKELNKIKRDVFPWLYNVPSSVIQIAEQNVDKAYKNFFRRVKAGEKPGFPKYKRRKDKTSFSFTGVKVESCRVRIPKIGWVKLKEKGYIPLNANWKTATVTYRAGRWFISVLVDENTEKDVCKNGVIGIDVGIKSLAYCSNGKKYENKKGIYDNEKKLRRLQRKLARQKNGSNRREETKKKIAQLYYKISCQRDNTIHEMTTDIVNRKPEVIAIETLKIKNMLKNNKLSKALSDASLYKIKQYLSYKAEQRGIELIMVDQWFPSTQMCSQCGAVKEKAEKMKLSHRTYKCAHCGAVIDRDYNAALNIKRYGECHRNSSAGRLEVHATAGAGRGTANQVQPEAHPIG